MKAKYYVLFVPYAFAIITGTILALRSGDTFLFIFAIAVFTAPSLLSWGLVSHYHTARIAKVLFQLQRIPLAHLGFSLTRFKSDDYFISTSKHREDISLLLLIIAGISITTYISGAIASQLLASIEETLLIGSNNTSFGVSNKLLLFGAIAILLGPFALSLIVYPIHVIDYFNLRLHQEGKAVVNSPTTPFKAVLGGTFTLTFFLQISQENTPVNLAWMLVYILAGVCLSIFLFKKYSEKKAIISFEEQLKKWGISSRNIQLKDLYESSGSDHGQG